MKGKAAESFEELNVYQRARELTNAVYALSRTGPFARDVGLVNQIRRAAVSIMSNIAEGFERGSRIEFIQFLYIAKGSCGEVRAQLQVAADQDYISQPDFARLTALCRLASSMISNFVLHLQKSDYQGEKVARPERLAEQEMEERRAKLRAAQLFNERAADRKKAEERKRMDDAENADKSEEASGP
jgi:four helix bundle protein